MPLKFEQYQSILKDNNSDDELNQQINDKLSELWTGMKNNKKQLLRSITPNYSRSRRTENTQSDINVSSSQYEMKHNYNLTSTNSQLKGPKQNLASQESSRINQLQIQKLKSTITQLTNDKRLLIGQLQSFNPQLDGFGEAYSPLNESSVKNSQTVTYLDGRTASFSNKKTVKGTSKKLVQNLNKKKLEYFSNKQNCQDYGNRQNSCDVLHQYQNSYEYQKQTNTNSEGKKRLAELLHSTAEYRQFAFYYDSHQLSYLKRLQAQHRRNCPHSPARHQQQRWAPAQLVGMLRNLNKNQQLDLSEAQIQVVISRMKIGFEQNQESNLKRLKQQYQSRVRELMREKQNSIPYDMVRLSNAKHRKKVQKYKSGI